MNNRVVNALAAVSLSALLVAAFGGMAGAADPADMVKERQQTMKKLGGGMGAVAKFVKNEGGTLEDAAKGAEAVVAVAKLDAKAVFVPGTAVGVGESAAKPELWQSWSVAEERWKAVQPAAVKLGEAIKGGDRAQIAQALGATSKTCGTCHEDFRVKKQ